MAGELIPLGLGKFYFDERSKEHGSLDIFKIDLSRLLLRSSLGINHRTLSPCRSKLAVHSFEFFFEPSSILRASGPSKLMECLGVSGQCDFDILDIIRARRTSLTVRSSQAYW